MIKKFIIIIIVLFLIYPLSAQSVNPREVLDEARRLTIAGKYQEALEKHIWFHKNALQYRPELSGTRLSLALVYWIELGQKYPKALLVLKDIRTHKERRLYKGENKWELFYDVRAINKYLNESSNTVKLFASIHEKNKKFARKCYNIVEEDLVNAKQFNLCIQYIGDFKKRFLDIIKKRERGIEYASTRSGIIAEVNIAATNKTFSNEVSRLIQILSNTDNYSEAIDLQNQALNIYYSEEIVSAIKKR